MMTLDEIERIVDEPGALMRLYEKHGKVPSDCYNFDKTDSNCACALQVIALDIGRTSRDWCEILPFNESRGFWCGFDNLANKPVGYDARAYAIGRRARIACGLEPQQAGG